MCFKSAQPPSYTTNIRVKKKQENSGSTKCPEDYWVVSIYEGLDKVRGNLEKGWDCGQYEFCGSLSHEHLYNISVFHIFYLRRILK
jgi:hypothetical protein